MSIEGLLVATHLMALLLYLAPGGFGMSSVWRQRAFIGAIAVWAGGMAIAIVLSIAHFAAA
ncbi:MAG: hypothetical protein ACFB3T_11570 [Geminicoccaceae bacterium]